MKEAGHGSSPSDRRRPLLFSEALIVLALLATGCTDDEPASSAAASAAPTKASSTPSGTPEDAVIAAYNGLYPAGRRAERTPDGQRRAVLAPYATQPLLDRMLRGTTALRTTGRYTWGEGVLHSFDVRIKGERASSTTARTSGRPGRWTSAQGSG